MSDFKKIDVSKLTKTAIKKLTFTDLVGDAAARKDHEAYEFLCKNHEENAAKEPLNRQHIQTIRDEYLRKYRGYTGIPSKPKTVSVFDQNGMLLDSVAHLFEDDTSCAS